MFEDENGDEQERYTPLPDDEWYLTDDAGNVVLEGRDCIEAHTGTLNDDVDYWEVLPLRECSAEECRILLRDDCPHGKFLYQERDRLDIITWSFSLEDCEFVKKMAGKEAYAKYERECRCIDEDEDEEELSVGELVCRKRIQLGMTQHELAVAVGVSQQVVSRIELGTQNPTLKTLQAVAEALGCHVTIADDTDE